MLIIKTNTERYHYELSNLAKLFFDAIQLQDWNDSTYDSQFVLEVEEQILEGMSRFAISASLDGINTYKNDLEIVWEENNVLLQRNLKRQLLKAYFIALQSLSPKIAPWGVLTGVRPSKLVHELLDQGLNWPEIETYLEDALLIVPEKAKLLMAVTKKERALVFPVAKKSFSVYIGIPFCPSRCYYCSFPSHSSEDRSLLTRYLNALIHEIEQTMPYMKAEDADSLYIGGGTPSVLSAEQTQRLLETIDQHIPLSHFKEITFEAGRPETIRPDILMVLKGFGIDRICLNPQSFNDKTLELVGRSHKAKDVETAYALLRQYGFTAINMDLIAGLPNETLEDWHASLSRAISLNPENITIHTLAIKSGAHFKKTGYVSPETQVMSMVEMGQKMLDIAGYSPYYLYRQKYIAANLENVGFSKPGSESRYNMQIMEERQNIYAFGVGAVSKILEENDRFCRVANPRDIKCYIETLTDVIDKKVKWLH